MKPKNILQPQVGLKEPEEKMTIVGKYEKRYITKCKVNPTILNTIFSSTCPANISFNMMMITNDHKVLLLERTESFHFPKVMKALKINKINLNLLALLYTSELEKLRLLFFDFIPPLNQSKKNKLIHIFPGGHCHFKIAESIFFTLMRELKEETSLNINIKDLRFNQSYIFNVLIYDLMIKRTFNNFVFPVKVNMTSDDILQKFKETKHTRNPTFVDIHGCKNLLDAFIQVQHAMLL
jgi:ADP-ribose pyrophosphatase YjhB (NUDIX family)